MKVEGPAKTWGICRLERRSFEVERTADGPPGRGETGHAKVSSCVGDFGNLLLARCAVLGAGRGEEGVNAENAGSAEGRGGVRGELGESSSQILRTKQKGKCEAG